MNASYGFLMRRDLSAPGLPDPKPENSCFCRVWVRPRSQPYPTIWSPLPQGYEAAATEAVRT